MPKKLKGGTLWDFSTSILSQNSKKIEEGPFGGFFFGKKSRSAEKKLKGDPLVSPDIVFYAGKQEKLFWFSSLGQMVQFGPIIFCRTFKNYFGQLVWIEKKKKKRVTTIVAFHFMKRLLKTFEGIIKLHDRFLIIIFNELAIFIHLILVEFCGNIRIWRFY